ncbi:MAG: hypothetical protein ACE5GX_15655 [Thermoanaerobaculia bacterium]
MRVLPIVLAFALASTAVEAGEVKRLFSAFAQGDARVLRIELPTGDLKVSKSSDRSVDGELVLSCTGLIDPCEAMADSIRFGWGESEGTQILSFDGPGSYEKRVGNFRADDTTTITDTKWGKSATKSKKRGRRSGTSGWTLSARLEVTVPTYDRLEVVLADGDLVLHDVEGACRVSVLSGTVRIDAPRSSVGRIAIKVKKGKAYLQGAEFRPIAGDKIRWQGPGEHDVRVDVGRGTVAVALY